MFKRAIAIIILTILGAGCSPLHHVRGHAVTVDPETIKVGEATREGVLQRLGEPNAIRDEGRIFAYTWDDIISVPSIWGDMSYYGTNHELLLIQFDEGGLVRRVDRTQRPEGVTLDEFLKTWVKGGTGAKP